MKVNIETQFICVPQNAFRGIPYYITNLIDALVKRKRNDYSVSFFDQYSERNNRKYLYDYIGEESLRNLKLFECNSVSYAEFASDSSEGWRKVNRTYNDVTGADADVFHFPHFLTLPFAFDGKMVVTIHDMLPLLPNAAQMLGDAHVSRQCHNYRLSIELLERNPQYLVIADSLSTKNDILNLTQISSDQVFVVPLAHDSVVHFPEKNKSLLQSLGIDAPYLCYLGQLDYRKGIYDMLEAFALVKPRFPDLKLVFAGRMPIKEHKEKIESHKYKEDIICLGFVNDEQKRALLSDAAAFLFPSEYEGFGLPVLEAMACGSPVITTNVSSLPEVGGDAAIYVSPKNPEQLAVEIVRLLNSENLRNEYIQKGFEQVKKFSWKKTAQMTEEVYEIAYRR